MAGNARQLGERRAFKQRSDKRREPAPSLLRSIPALVQATCTLAPAYAVRLENAALHESASGTFRPIVQCARMSVVGSETDIGALAILCRSELEKNKNSSAHKSRKKGFAAGSGVHALACPGLLRRLRASVQKPGVGGLESRAVLGQRRNRIIAIDS